MTDALPFKWGTKKLINMSGFGSTFAITVVVRRGDTPGTDTKTATTTVRSSEEVDFDFGDDTYRFLDSITITDLKAESTPASVSFAVQTKDDDVDRALNTYREIVIQQGVSLGNPIRLTCQNILIDHGEIHTPSVTLPASH